MKSTSDKQRSLEEKFPEKYWRLIYVEEILTNTIIILLQFFGNEGCNMVEMTCEQHDEISAETQFTTHLVGRTLGRMSLTQTAIDTKGYEALLRLVENTNNDSFELFYGLFMYNEVNPFKKSFLHFT